MFTPQLCFTDQLTDQLTNQPVIAKIPPIKLNNNYENRKNPITAAGNSYKWRFFGCMKGNLCKLDLFYSAYIIPL